MIFLSERCEQQLLTDLGGCESHTQITCFVSYGSFIKDLKSVGMWGITAEFYESGRFNVLTGNHKKKMSLVRLHSGKTYISCF